MQVIKQENSRPIKAWVEQNEDGTPKIEDSALTQLKNLARLPFLAANGVAVMPDVHAGIGSTVGSVIATHKAIIPAAVGVDIGCGMNAVRTSLKAGDLPFDLLAVRRQIERDIPLGAGGQVKDHAMTAREKNFWGGENNAHTRLERIVENGVSKHSADKLMQKAINQLGSLGSGNHFIEICLDENDDVWIMLHSGSRGIGNIIGSSFIAEAKEVMARWHITLPDDNLAYFPEGTPEFDRYTEAVHWAQEYALENRREMMKLTIAALMRHTQPFTLTSEAVNCHHNYVELENHFGQNIWVTRKGAVRAREGDLGIIPGSMGQRSYIVRGKGNPQSYCSCSHGAGRLMSRTAAKARFSLTDLVNQTEGVECRKDSEVIDEIPGAYKNLDAVMAAQTDLVEVVHTLKAVLCVKGN